MEALLEQLQDELTGHTLSATPSAEAGDTEGRGQSPRRFQFRRSATEVRCKARSSSYSSLSSRRISSRDRLDIGPSGTAHDAIKRVAEAILSSGRRASSTSTCAPTFDNVRHDRLLAKVAQQVDDAEVLHLLKVMLKASGKKWAFHKAAIISPLAQQPLPQ